MNKYRNKKVQVNGIIFDSKHEARRYMYLKGLEERGVIHDIRLQVPFELIPAQKLPQPIKDKGRTVKTLRGCTYKADFVYWRADHLVVEDAKGLKTPEYQIKKKLMLQKYGIQIMEV